MKRFISLFASLLVCAFGAAWFSQDSINAYWQQTYHQASPLEPLSEYEWWRTGAKLQQDAYAFSDDLKARLAGQPVIAEPEPQIAEDDGSSEQNAQLNASEPHEKNRPADGRQPQTAQNGKLPEAHHLPVTPPANIVLGQGDKVFFAGDSMMQGVAPFVERSLKKQYGIQSVNLSKQSTGLSYPKFFDWPNTIEQTLKQQTDIRLLVVFLGPNDPWDFPKGKKYLKFASPEWSEEYLSRVNRILAAAEQHHVQVIWMGIPYMKQAKLNKQMRYLDKLLADEISPKALWIPTDKLLSNGSDTYADSVNINGKIIRYRSKDGIHFSAEGQKLLADKIMEKIVFQTTPEMNGEERTEQLSAR